jgi:hypothetical protein
MKTILTSLAFGKPFAHESQINLIEDAKKYFTGTAKFTDTNIEPSFLEKNKEIFAHKRGWGFWLWKPYIIKKTLEHLDNGDICLYCDVGNSIIHDPAPLFKLCKEVGGILLFENRDGNPTGKIWRNAEWVKMDCYNLMDCREDRYINGNQVDGAYSVWEKNKNTMKFVDQYLAYCENINIISDLPNITGDNISVFKDHRHDQSVLSLMAIKHGIQTFPEPSEWGNHCRLPNAPYGHIFWHHRCMRYGRKVGE